MSLEESDSPDPFDVMQVAIEAALDGVRTTLPGKITAYDDSTGRASVVALVQHAHIDEDGNRVVKTLPEIHEVPVLFLGPARGRISWPVAVGDLCIFWCCSSSLDQLLQRGVDKPVDPKDDRRHDLNDAIALVGFSTSSSRPTDYIFLEGDVKLGGNVVAKKLVNVDFLDGGTNNWSTFLVKLLAVLGPLAALPGMNATVTALGTEIGALQLLNATWKTTKTEAE